MAARRALVGVVLGLVAGAACSGSDARPGVLERDHRPLGPSDAAARPPEDAPAPRDAPPEASAIPSEPPPEPVEPPGPCGACARLCAPEDRCLTDTCTPRSDGVPRLLAPASLGRLTTQRPTLRWILPVGASGAQVELCRDRACRDLVARHDAPGQSLRLTEALAPGVYFWRVAPRRRGVLEEKFSATWEFVARSRDSAVDSSHGRHNDVNGDGYADFVLLHDGRAGLYLGGPEGLGRVASQTLRVGASGRAGAVGDLDGDGFGDVLAVTPEAMDPARRRVAWHRGGPSGLREAVELRADGPWPEGLSGVGDLDGDGYGDLLGVDASRDGATARRVLFRGASRGVEAAPVAFLGMDEPWRGHASLGDINGDGRPDLLLGAPHADGSAGRAALWRNRGGCADGALAPLPGPPVPEARFGEALQLAGDFNGDGYADPVVTAPFGPAHDGRGQALVFQGPESISLARALPFAGPQLEGMRVGAADVNGDGYTDLVVWLHNEVRGPAMHVFHGGAAGLVPTPEVVVYPQAYGAVETALSFAVAGDTDRDGYDDLVVYLGPGEVLLSRGGARGLRVEPSGLLTLP